MQTKQKKKLTLFALTWPIFIEILLHMLMGNADTLMLSQYDDNAVASVGVSNQILAVIIVMFGFVATGTTVLIAQQLGADKKKDAGQTAVVSVVLNLIFGLILSVPLLFFGEPILRLMQLPPELMDQSLIYLQIVGGFSFIQAMLMTFSAIIKSHGFTKDAMYVTIGMNILNVIGNYLFIFGSFGFPELGVQGVAISTAFSRGIGLFVLFILLIRRTKNDLPWSYLKKKASKKEVKDLLKIGIPSAGEQLSYNISQMVITSFIATMGTIELTTRVYTMNIVMFAFLFSIAIGQGSQILIGYLIGEGKKSEAYASCLRSVKIGVTVSITATLIFAMFPDQLLGIFTSNPEIIQLGGTLLLLSVILEPGRALNLIIINALRASGDVYFPVFVGIICMWIVAVGVAYFAGISLGLALIGIWIALILDEWIRGLLMLGRWRSRKWESMSFVKKKTAA